jgi:opacity protein-like surface antigen
MKKWILLLGIGLLSTKAAQSQNVAIKSNLLYDATTTINLGVEFALADQWTLDISGNYNPWVFPQAEITIDPNGVATGETVEWTGKLKHWMLQPELRWWSCEKFTGHFFGVHAHTGMFNVGGLTFLPDGFGDGYDLKNPSTGLIEHVNDGIQHKRFQGFLMGAGVSYGYHLILSNRFSLEFSLGLGYTYLKYDKYDKCDICGTIENSKYMNYFGPTKAGISAIFMLK